MAGTNNELWTVYELATACPVWFRNTGHMKQDGSMTRKHSIHMLWYIIHMCTKTCTAGTDSRIVRYADT